MTSDLLWQMETDFWLKGTAFFETALAPDAIMVFPAPVGVLKGRAILDSLQGVPRWTSCRFEDKVASQAGDAAVLVYRVSALRAGTEPYRATCTSTYVRHSERWLLLAHQQTPAE